MKLKLNKFPKNSKIFNKRKHKKEPWMTNNLLVRTNRKNDMYRDWKSTNNNKEYEVKKKFRNFDNIITEEIKNAKDQYYFDTFTSHKNDMKKTWKTTDETLNSGKGRTQFPNEFTIGNKSITDHKEIADQFNIFFLQILVLN